MTTTAVSTTVRQRIPAADRSQPGTTLSRVSYAEGRHRRSKGRRRPSGRVRPHAAHRSPGDGGPWQHTPAGTRGRSASDRGSHGHGRLTGAHPIRCSLPVSLLVGRRSVPDGLAEAYGGVRVGGMEQQVPHERGSSSMATCPQPGRLTHRV
jgi:hypothetical protein